MSNPEAFVRALGTVAAAAGRASTPRFDNGRVSLMLDVTGLAEAEHAQLKSNVEAALAEVAGVNEVRVALTAQRTGRTLIAVASGKGGVGKSTVAANLAIALARAGTKAGLIDADIYGPSQPRLMATEGERPTATDKKLNPVATRFGVPMLSMGHMVKPGQAIAWRGPMTGSALGQLVDADWGDRDTLIVDLPAGHRRRPAVDDLEA